MQRFWSIRYGQISFCINVLIEFEVIPSILVRPTEVKEKHRYLFAYLSTEVMEENKGKTTSLRRQIRKCNLSKSCLLGSVLGEIKQSEVLVVSPSAKYIGMTNKCRLHIWKVPYAESDNAVVKKIVLHHTKKMTALAFHPTQQLVAAGDVTGRILIWRQFGDKTFASNGVMTKKVTDSGEEDPGVRGSDDADSCSTWHWHPAEVNVLSFSSDGAYLYSGGKEGVLVVWQLDTGKKKFLPRIGSPLLYFIQSPDPSISFISCADNQIHLLKMPSMEILKTISGIKAPSSYHEMYKGLNNGVAFVETSGLVALRTDSYCVQLYSLFDDHEVSEVQVCERNHQPGDDVTVVVTQVALSLDGCMMSTAEIKLAEEGIGGQISLKFWASGSQNMDFSLSTIVYEPHRDAAISAIAFHPSGHMAVSSSYGGDFKVWVCCIDNPQKDQIQNTSWTCHSVGSYKKKPMTAAAFSGDGSVLAVAAETLITLWNPEKNVLLAVIGETLSPVVTLSFIGTSEHLVAASLGPKPQLSVWSMSKLSVSWSSKLCIEALATSASSFAALLLPEPSNGSTHKESDGLILLFKATDPVPVVTWSAKKAKGGTLGFIQRNQSSTEGSETDSEPWQLLLAYLNGDHEYVIFNPYSKVSEELSVCRREGVTALGKAGEQTRQFGYASIYGELPQLDLKTTETSWTASFPSERPWETIFSGSSHNLPLLNKLCSGFLESLLERRTVVVE